MTAAASLSPVRPSAFMAFMEMVPVMVSLPDFRVTFL